nr:MoaD/ThiS family protein [uncultured Sphingomonas sp.]
MGKQTLHVELCGQFADLHGRVIAVALPKGGMTVGTMMSQIAADYPSLQAALVSGRVRACVNDSIVAASDAVTVGDRVALFPPVSGG